MILTLIVLSVLINVQIALILQFVQIVKGIEQGFLIAIVLKENMMINLVWIVKIVFITVKNVQDL